MRVDELPRIDGELLDLDELASARRESWIARSDRGLEVLDYDGGFRALEHPDLQKGPTFTRRIDELGMRGEARRYLAMALPNTEGEYRRHLRAPMAALFRPSQVQKLRDAIRGIARGAVAALDADGPVDLMERLCWVVPSQTYCEMVAMPYELAPVVRRIGDSLLGVLLTRDVSRLAEAEAAVVESVEMAKEHLAARRRHPGGDFTSAMIQQQERGLLTEDELFVEVFSILQASVDNTAHMMGNTFGLLLAEPERWAALRADPSTVGAVIEEAIRLAPRFCTIFRLAARDVELDGVEIPEGTWVYVSVRAGQRDPSVYERPDEWDVARPTNRRLMFGAGPYNCLGQGLARMEIEETLLAVLDRFPDLALDSPWERRETNAVSETKALPVRVG